MFTFIPAHFSHSPSSSVPWQCHCPFFSPIPSFAPLARSALTISPFAPLYMSGQGMAVIFLSCTIFRAKIQLFLQMCNFFCIFVAKTMIYGYIRVSSDKQTVENQRFEIERFCKVNNLHIDGWIEETISGTKAYNKRQLGVLLKKVEKEDVIICSELSRLGRSLFMIMEILSICMKKECRVWTIKDNYRLGDDIQSKVLAFAFGLSAEIERNLISQRTKEALARKRAEGVQLGRPKGKQSRQCTYKLHKKEELIRGLLAEGVSFKKVGDILHVNKDTVRKYYHTFMEN